MTQRSVININTTRLNRSLYADLHFEREIEPIDVERCRRAFALALTDLYRHRGVVLETIDFESRHVLPADYDEFPYSMSGMATRAKGQVTAEELGRFDKSFEQYLEATGKYTVRYHRRTIQRRPRDAD